MATPSNTHRQDAAPKQWLLIVFDGSRHHELMASIGLKPSKSKAGQYIRFYPPGTTGILRHQIDRLKKAGLHGVAKKVEQRPRLPREPRSRRPKPDKTRFVYRPTAEVIPINRRELQRQAEQTRLRDIDDHVKNVLRRTRGE